ncbi:MAG: hypothetical protein JSW10_05130 [Pseudomonadota bacterium]|nr:MAG: hypothetical protein JSW10_05130 [Pseudomonadota bacterium]
MCSLKHVLFVGLLLMTVFGEHATASPEEVMKNSGFETGKLDPWFNPSFDPDKWSVVSDNPHSGTYSAFTSTAGTGGTSLVSQSFAPVAVNDIVSAGLWYFNDPTGSTGTVGLATLLTFSDGTSVQDTLSADDPTYKENEWAFRDLMPTIRGNSGKRLVEIGVFDKLNTRTYIDDVSIEIRDSSDLACYKIQTRHKFKQRHVTITDQFGTFEATIIRPTELCVPASKELPVKSGKE